MESEKQTTAYVPWTNTDRTEGRGATVPLAVCKTEATARRIGAKAGVMGSNCEVTPVEIYRKGARWYGPVHLHNPTKEDEVEQKRIDARNAAREKALAAGMSEEDLQNLMR